jgi:hypothetical protein
LLDDGGSASERHVLSSGGFRGLLQRGLDAIGDEMKGRAPLHLERLPGVMGEDEDGVVVWRILPPVARPRIRPPRARTTSEHVATHHGRADVLEPTLHDRCARIDLAALLALHLAKGSEREHHSFSCIPPIPNGFSALCSGRATKPSSDIIMCSLSSLIAATQSRTGTGLRRWNALGCPCHPCSWISGR